MADHVILEPVVGPLKGLRDLDVGTMIAAPLACTLMADFGADVIKVEHPTLGDTMRSRPPDKEGVSLAWKVMGRNKRTISLDLSIPEGQEILKQLVKKSDVLVENFRPGTLERWNLGYDVLSKVNPRLIMTRISGYGQTGPYNKRAGYGTVAEAMSGIPSYTGFPDRPPSMFAIPMGDSVAATFAALATMCAIFERDQGGSAKGQEIDVSLFEPLFRYADVQTIAFDQLGMVRQRMGNRNVTDAPRNAYRTRDDRYIAISGGADSTFRRLAEAMCMPNLPKDPRFVDAFSRQANADVLDDIVAGWFLLHNCDHILHLFNEKDVVAGAIYDIRDIFADPQFSSRDTIVDVEDRDFGSVKMPNVIPRFVRTPGKIRHTGRQLGEDNVEVYCSELGLSHDDLVRLKSLRVI